MIDLQTIPLLRYLLLLRVHKPLLVLPPYLALELAYATSVMISERLPSSQLKPWRKLVAAWEQANPVSEDNRRARLIHNPPQSAWPLDLAWLPYRVKQTYGHGEIIPCELKLFGRSASHELFLELILPVLETAGLTPDRRWSRPNSFWGGFHLEAVYVAHGRQWEPVVEDGQVDFSIRPGSRQWCEGLDFTKNKHGTSQCLRWYTPYAHTPVPSIIRKREHLCQIARENAPGMPVLLKALFSRLGVVAPEAPVDWLSELDALAMEVGNKTENVICPPKNWPGTVWGEQVFSPVPDQLVHVLKLASTLHVGCYTHVGCGTFHIKDLRK